jgi:two-component system OmpR family response regulator
MAPGSGARTACRSKGRILLIENDAETLAAIFSELPARGYAIEHTASGAIGLALARDGGFDLIIVDRLASVIDGLRIVKTLRAENSRVPLLVLSALTDVSDRVHGLMAGCDDYLVKPFVVAELAARVEALLRRPFEIRETSLQLGSLELDLIERKAYRNGREIELLPREFKLLQYLMRHPEQLLTRELLLRQVWNYQTPPRTNLVDVHIGKLRRKIHGPDEEALLRSVRGFGFIMRRPDHA